MPTYTYIHTYIHTHTQCIYIYMCVCVCVCVYDACMYVCVYICMLYVFMHVYMMYVCVYVCMNVCMYVCMLFCVCVCKCVYGNAYHRKQTKRNCRQKGFQHRRSNPHQISSIFVSRLFVSNQCNDTETQRVKAKSYSRRNLTMKAQGPSQASSCGICSCQSVSMTSFSPNNSVSSHQRHSPTFHAQS